MTHSDPHRTGRALLRDRSALDELRDRESGRGVLLTDAVVVSMDPEIGDFDRADVLIHGSNITAVGPDLHLDPRASDALVIDCTGLILTPGFHDTHRHSWQGQLRRYIPDHDQDGYIADIHMRLAHQYRSEDMYAGNLVTALGALDAGVTTILDFSHNSRSSAHSDAAIEAWDRTGIRAVHASAAPFDGEWDRQWPADLQRLSRELPSSGLITLRMALLPKAKDVVPDILAMSPANLSLARGLGIGTSVDGVFGPEASRQVELLDSENLLGPDLTFIHCTDLSDAAWDAIVRSGTHVSLAPTSDAQVGIESGVAPIQKCLDLGLEPSISVDIECSLAADMFSQMRALLTIQRMGIFSRRAAGEVGVPPLVTNREVLRFATLSGARANGLEHCTGSLTPGKQADIIGVRFDDINVFPLNNAIGTVVQGADSRNIECVFVAGRAVKWQREVVTFDLSSAQGLATESRDRLFGAAGVSLDVLV